MGNNTETETPPPATTSSKWLEFVDLPEFSYGKKTIVWEVRRKDGSAKLGRIGWYGAWRGYAFFPYKDCLFEQTCLRDIADFIEDQNKKHRLARKESK